MVSQSGFLSSSNWKIKWIKDNDMFNVDYLFIVYIAIVIVVLKKKNYVVNHRIKVQTEEKKKKNPCNNILCKTFMIGIDLKVQLRILLVTA